MRKQLNERLQALDDALWIKESLLDAMRTEKFTVTDYLKRKAKVMLSLEGKLLLPVLPPRLEGEKERKERTRSNSGKVKVEVPTDILHPELYRALSEWRTAKTRRSEYAGLCDHAAKGIDGYCESVAGYTSSFEAIPYFGARKEWRSTDLKFWALCANMKENKLERPEIFTSVSGGEDVREKSWTRSIMRIRRSRKEEERFKAGEL